MATDARDSGLGEALASYQPTSMTPPTWARFREDALALVGRLDHLDESAAKPTMSRLVAFLADLADVRPDADLADLLTPEQVAGYLEREKASGAPAGTLENRQGTLNTLLRALDGDEPRTTSRSPENHLAPYDRGRLLQLVDAAVVDGSDAAADFARTVLCGLVGHRLSRSQPVEVAVGGPKVSAGDSVAVFDDVRLPAGGTVDAAAVDRGREWADEAQGFRLDLRRLVLSHIAHVVANRPALEALRLEGVGRDRLTAAVTAAPAVDNGRTRRLLRDAA